METGEWNGVENKSRCGTYIAAIFSFLPSDTMAQGARMPQRKWFRSHMEEINIWVPAVEMPPPITRRLLLREVDRQQGPSPKHLHRPWPIISSASPEGSAEAVGVLHLTVFHLDVERVHVFLRTNVFD